MCVYPHYQNIHTFHHLMNRRLEACKLIISFHEHSHLCIIHLHHSIFLYHNIILSQLSQSLPFSPSLSSPFYQYVFRDQHKLNFGTKFLLEGKTVTTHHFTSFTISGHFPKLRLFTIHKSLFIKTLFIVLLFIIFEVNLIF